MHFNGFFELAEKVVLLEKAQLLAVLSGMKTQGANKTVDDYIIDNLVRDLKRLVEECEEPDKELSDKMKEVIVLYRQDK